MAETPKKEGFFWGQWRIKADDTYPICKGCGKPLYPGCSVNEPPGQEWEIMHVVENCNDETDPEYLMVMVPGVASWQPLENFVWGTEVKGP